MAGKINFVFEDIPSGAGKVKLVFIRDCTELELQNNPITSTQDLTIDCEPNLILLTPAQEGTIEASNGNSLCGEMTFKMLDTFQKHLLTTHGARIGFDNTFDRSINFGLLALMTEWDITARKNEQKETFPPGGIVVEYYLNNYQYPKMKGVVDAESITYDVDFVYGKTVKGQYLLEKEFFVYDAAEKVIDFTCIDLIRKMLLATPVREGFMYSGDEPGWPGGSPYKEWLHSPVKYDNDPVEDAQILNEFTNSANYSPLESPFKYLTIFNCGHESHTDNRRRGMSWVGFSIADMMKRLYDRAFVDWIGEADRSAWKFYCAGIGATAFGSSDSNGYRPYLKNRLQLHEPSGHNVTTKFRLLKQDADDEEIFLDSSFATDFISINHGDFEHGLWKLPSAWEVVTKVPSSLGYRTRFSWKLGKPRAQHMQKSLRPPLVKIPAPIAIKGIPFGNPIDAVTCKPRTGFGMFQTVRRTVTDPSYDNDPLNSTCQWDRGKRADMKEPYFDDTRIVLVWDNEGAEYFDVYKSEVSTTGKLYLPQFIKFDTSSGAITYPDIPTVLNALECETCFGLFGNYPLLVFGGTNGGAGTAKGYKEKMSPEFVYVPAGTVAEMVLLHRDENTSDVSSYPGLILFAGRDSSDNGKTITTASTPGGDNYDFYRGAGSIDVPYGDGYVRAYSARSALAIFNVQHHVGIGQKYTIVVPGVDNFENEKGETGYEAIYEGLALEIFNGLFLIDRVKQLSETGETEIDISRIPYNKPEISSESPRVEFIDDTGVTDSWNSSYKLYWRGSGGGDTYELIANIH